MFQQDRILVNWAANAHDRVFHRYRWFLFLIDPFSVFSTLARSEPPNKIQLVSARLRLIVEAAVRTPPAKLPRRAHSRPAAARRDARVYHGLNVSFHRRRMTSSQLGRRSGVRPSRRPRRPSCWVTCVLSALPRQLRSAIFLASRAAPSCENSQNFIPSENGKTGSAAQG